MTNNTITNTEAAYIISGSGLTYINPETHKTVTIGSSRDDYEYLTMLFDKGEYSVIEETIDPSLRVKKLFARSANGSFELKDGCIFDTKRNEVVNSFITSAIIDIATKGGSIINLLNFMELLDNNPSFRVRQRLYSWLTNANMPITPSGKFLAYKKVRSDYKSIHDGKTDNSVGTVVSMPRHLVDDNDDNTCSEGLHVCSRSYLPEFGCGGGEKVVLCEVDPADVVAIPKDYNDTKMRVCSYKVLADITEEFDAVDFNLRSSPTVNPCYDCDSEYDEEDEDESYTSQTFVMQSGDDVLKMLSALFSNNQR